MATSVHGQLCQILIITAFQHSCVCISTPLTESGSMLDVALPLADVDTHSVQEWSTGGDVKFVYQDARSDTYSSKYQLQDIDHTMLADKSIDFEVGQSRVATACLLHGDTATTYT